MKNLGPVIALLAGLAGGFLSHYVVSEPAQAQPAIPFEVRAQRFILVDVNGQPQAMFTLRPSPEPNRPPSIILYRADGQLLWTAGAEAAPSTKQ